MRTLPLPCALLVMAAVAVACENAPNSEVVGPQLGLAALAGCPAGFDLTTERNYGTLNIDRNKDGYICTKTLPNGQQVAHDNSVPLNSATGCPVGTTVIQVKSHPADFNRDGFVCVNGSGNLFTDNAFPPDDGTY